MVLVANGYLIAMVAAGEFTPWTLLALLALPPGLKAAIDLLRFAGQPARLVLAIRLTIVSLLAHGLLLAVGLALGA